jgi:hypothetical protein
LWNWAQDEKLFPKAEIPLNIFFPLFGFLTKKGDFVRQQATPNQQRSITNHQEESYDGTARHLKDDIWL